MKAFVRVPVRLILCLSALAAVVGAADLLPPEEAPEVAMPVRPNEYRGPSIRDVVDAYDEEGYTSPADVLDIPGTPEGRWHLQSARRGDGSISGPVSLEEIRRQEEAADAGRDRQPQRFGVEAD